VGPYNIYESDMASLDGSGPDGSYLTDAVSTFSTERLCLTSFLSLLQIMDAFLHILFCEEEGTLHVCSQTMNKVISGHWQDS
jgi:hypothetical protein